MRLLPAMKLGAVADAGQAVSAGRAAAGGP